MEILILIVVILAIYWAKNNLLTPNASQSIEIFSSRGATFVKKTLKSCVNQKIESDYDTTAQQEESTSAVEIQSPSECNPPSQFETEAKSEEPILEVIVQSTSNTQAASDTMPQDSVLRRHYLAQLAAEQAAIKNPYPTDSILRRHYEHQQIASLGLSGNINAPVIADEFLPSDVNTSATNTAKQNIPEDSVLKRHFMSQLQSEIENNYAPRPSDAVLKRHYAQLIQSKIEAYITA